MYRKTKPAQEIFVPAILPPWEDGVFKTLLTHPDAKPVLRDLIAGILRIPIADVDVRNTELPISDIAKKRARFDVNCRTKDGRQIDVEMQSAPMTGDSETNAHANLRDRAVYYVCDLHSAQAGRGTDYGDLMQSYQITFCGFTVFPEREDFIGRFRLRDEEGFVLSDAIGIVFVELSKLDAAMTKSAKNMMPDEMWAVFFGHANEPEWRGLIHEITRAKEEIRMANELLTSISKDEIERAHYRSRKMYRMDMEHDKAVLRKEIEAGRAEGHAEGRAAGHAEGRAAGHAEGRAEGQAEGRATGHAEGHAEGRATERAEVAKKLLKMHMSIADIAEATGLSHAEIESLPKND
jgi:predicted transposase/invertase (TIGR01784 family)